MGMKRIGYLLLLSFVIALTISRVYSFDVTYFQNFNYTPCGCHSTSPQQHLSAIVMVNDPGLVIAGSKFNITVAIEGFTGSTDPVVVGLLHSQNDNALFDGPTGDVRKEVTLDVNGDGATQFELTAPNTPGKYTIKVTVLDGADGSTAKGFVYAENTQIVQVRTLSNYYAQYAIGAAEYLISVAIPEGGGYKWAEDNITTPAKYKTGFLKGAAGTGNYLLDLYKATGNTTYLDYARGAAQWLISVAFAEGGGYKWEEWVGAKINQTGYYPGAAGIGTFFLSMYETTGNTTYLDYAKGAAQWLISEAYSVGGGYAWVEKEGEVAPGKLSTRWSYGSPGIGTFLVKAYLLTANTTYADYAKDVAQWLTSVAIPEGGGYKWPQRVEETNYLTGTWHGAAGIGNFFIEAYQAFGNATYLDYAEGAAQWLISVAFAEGGGYKWENLVGGGEFIRGWSRGAPGTGAFFLRIYEETNNPTYLDYAKRAAQWLTYVAIPESGGYKWADSNFSPGNYTALGHGAAGIGKFFILAYTSTNNATYLDYAEDAAQWLTSLVISIDGGYAWLREPKESAKQIHTTYYYGVAGVGDFYLSLATLSVTIQTISHIVTWEGVDYTVVTTSNSTVGPVQFNQPQMEISFTVTGAIGTTGFVNVTIPKDLMKGEPWLVLVDGIETSYQKSENTTHTFLYFTYSHNTGVVQIRGTWVIPEFPTLTILLILLITSLAGAILGKLFWLKRRKHP